MKKIFLVEDDKTISKNLMLLLQSEGFAVSLASTQKEAVDMLAENRFDMALVDISLPDGNGFAVCTEIKQTQNIPVIFLTASGDEASVVTGLNMGADDYVTKPFSPKEVVARVKAILKRDGKIKEIYQYKDLMIDYKGRKVTIDEKEIELTPKEYELLTYFISNKGIALSRESLLNVIWGYDFYGDYRTVDTHIKMLRRSLGKYRDLIKTVRAVGYKYETE